MVFPFAMTEINYLVVSLFYDLVRPFSYLYLLVLSSLNALFAWFLALGQKRLCLTRIHSPHFSRSPSGQLIFKQLFSLNSVLQIVRFMV